MDDDFERGWDEMRVSDAMIRALTPTERAHWLVACDRIEDRVEAVLVAEAGQRVDGLAVAS